MLVGECPVHMATLMWVPVIPYLSRDMRFLAMWYVRPAQAQTSLRKRAVWSEPLLVTYIFYVWISWHLEFPSLKWGCTGSSESTLVKMPHFWKSHVMAHFFLQPWAIIETVAYYLLPPSRCRFSPGFCSWAWTLVYFFLKLKYSTHILAMGFWIHSLISFAVPTLTVPSDPHQI